MRERERERQGKERRNLQRKSWVAFASSRKVEGWVGGFVRTESFPMRVWITVWDAGSVIAYLYSDDCSYITHCASAGRIPSWENQLGHWVYKLISGKYFCCNFPQMKKKKKKRKDLSISSAWPSARRIFRIFFPSSQIALDTASLFGPLSVEAILHV